LFSHDGCTILDSNDLFQDVIERPEKTLENENTLCGNYIESKFHTIKQTGLFFDKAAHKKGFSTSNEYNIYKDICKEIVNQ